MLTPITESTVISMKTIQSQTDLPSVCADGTETVFSAIESDPPVNAAMHQNIEGQQIQADPRNENVKNPQERPHPKNEKSVISHDEQSGTKMKIEKAFWKLYGRVPIEKISVSAIAKEAGIHRSTFYLYYEDRYAVLEQMEEQFLRDFQALVDDIRISDFSDAFHRIYTTISKYQLFLKTMIFQKGDSNLQRKMMKIGSSFLNRVARTVFEPCSEEQITQLRIVFAGFWFSFLQSVIQPGISEDTALKLTKSLLLHAYLPVIQQQVGIVIRDPYKRMIEEKKAELQIGI